MAKTIREKNGNILEIDNQILLSSRFLVRFNKTYQFILNLTVKIHSILKNYITFADQLKKKKIMNTVFIKNKIESKAGIKTKTFSTANANVWNTKRRFV